ncbi:hypothetical protein J4G63_10745 [Aeromonas sobria]|uniref:hypothetical protein n=1 Tax=Aeromonas sobria TaxID=646 RepID=UPI001BCE127C|nr:hypothetical protein [Aeromonas sobria]MBS4687714.1 hypothetical protein [Aeromonas sobria]
MSRWNLTVTVTVTVTVTMTMTMTMTSGHMVRVSWSPVAVGGHGWRVGICQPLR